MSDRFKQIIEFTLKNEGGYVFDPQDSGGETKYGISKRSYPHVDIKHLTQLQAVAIYKRDFWDKYPFDKIEDFEVCAKLFDMAVNMGFVQAAKLLQRCLGVADDGIIGTKTLQAINDANAQDLLSAYKAKLREFYALLVTKNPKNERFFNGWIRRVSL